jgi:segregation and condensation protein A
MTTSLQTTPQTFEIKLPQFEGPFDLLLFFIERDELDIYDIPIFTLTTEFLTYIKTLEQLNLNVAGEFLLVAATLMRIKAKMLIPRKEIDEQGNEIDPRTDLIEKLLEYKKYKAIVTDLETLETQRQNQHRRSNLDTEIQDLYQQNTYTEELSNLTLYQLLKAFQTTIDRQAQRQNQPTHTIIQYPYSIAQKKEFLTQTITQRTTLNFEEFIAYCTTKIEAIYAFLAMLELVQMQILTITIGEGFNQFWLQLHPNQAQTQPNQ